MYHARHVAALVANLLVAACTPADRDPAADTAAVRQELTDRMAAYEEALRSGDVERIRAFWTADLRVLEPGLDLSGDQAREFMTGFFATGRVISLDLEAYDTFAHGDAAYQVGEYDEILEVGGAQLTVRNYYFLRWEKGADGVWRFDRLVAGPREAPSAM